MAKTICKIFGAVLLVVGIVGFFIPHILSLHLTPIHNVVHILTGLVALYFGVSGSDASARTFSQVFGAIYTLLGVVGFVQPAIIATVIQFHETTGTGNDTLIMDNIVHLLVGLVFLIVGFIRAPQPASTT
jgi:preprotein translocase subunit Sss1